MKLYESHSAPNPRRVRMFLAEKGLLDQVELVQVDLKKGENLQPEFSARNPMRKVPVLELDDGNCISDSMAICRYFEELHPDSAPLLGRSPLEKAQIEQWLRRIEDYFLRPVEMCFQHTSGYFDDRLTPVRVWGEACGEQAGAFLGYLDQELRLRPRICGDAFTAVDITAFCALEFARLIKVRVQPEQEALQQWYETIKTRPSASV